MKQNNQGSWAARLRKITALCLMLVVSAGAWADNKLTIKPDIKAGETTGTITIALDNATDYTAFEMEIKLPEGLSIENSGAMQIVSAVNADHNVAYNTVDGVTKVVAYSFDGASKGNEAFKATGDLLVINVSVASDYEPADVEVLGITFVTFSDLEAVTNFEVVNEQGDLMGDVNGDGKVNTADAVKVLYKFLDLPITGTFNEKVADLNGDGKINTSDAVRIIFIFIEN